MIRRLSFLFFTLFLISACTNDDDNPDTEENSTSLTIRIIDGDKDPVPNIEIYTEPKTQTLRTNSKGIVRFVNISPGTYTVFMNVSDYYSFEVEVEVRLDEDNFLEFSTLDIDPVEESPLDFGEFLSNVYANLQEIYKPHYFVNTWGDIGADMIYVNPNAADPMMDRYSFDSNNSIISLIWDEHYNQINDINYGLNKLYETRAEKPESQLEVFESELRFLRALLYFNLVKRFGNPLIAEYSGTLDYDPSATIQGGNELYDLIISDLLFAQDYLPPFEQADKASLEAAQALLGKVYLQSAGFPLKRVENYAKALEQLNKIEASFELENNYASIFNRGNTNGNEIIFKIEFEESNEHNTYGNYWGPQGTVLHDILLLNQDYIFSYLTEEEQFEQPVTFPIDLKDSRFYTNIATFKLVNGEEVNAEALVDWRPYKFFDSAAGNSGVLDFPVLRYADILLMIAEAENRVNGPTMKAYDAVNEVRRRAYGSTSYDLPANLTTTEFLEAVLSERKKELSHEGHRKDDLIRTENLADIIAAFNEDNPNYQRNFEDYKYIWPIPQRDISINPYIKQNPGY
ncbi:RagB/SusD family nutrient uptake outer membrane protein [Flavimarina sp. Hel_I_48]|uniref:RagB/SusD family nutrient uptake outer membrane protein n=1 Tax=Flavimarina sp. Hel_I_48 TaxID=1392488 RepID=UPI0004DF047B|nr:RagB/SusD family nutrient uptake outer membrane protein [Flavimarina sp. Hel_I_48]